MRAQAPRPPIRLRIAGKQLLLEGRFHHWTPVAMVGLEGEPSVVQILFDGTSVSPAAGQGASEDLLSFTARTARKVGQGSYRVKGTLRVRGPREAGAAARVEALVQSPQAHSPFLFVTLPIDRAQHARLWESLGEVAANAVSNEPEMRPQAWLVAPKLAAA
jgi:hypothetical protein